MNTDRERQPPSERFAVQSITLDLHAEVAALRAESSPTKHGHRQKSLFKNGGRTIALFVMDVDASLPEHAAGGTVTVQPIEGEFMAVVEGKEQRLVPGQILIMRPRMRHSVRAITTSAFLLQVSLEADTTSP
ncbi:MAG: cupin domain-containing protein [Phycisphaerales bacterium]|nr:cupin domain-containing protein [Phycisphaerales bacterium]